MPSSLTRVFQEQLVTLIPAKTSVANISILMDGEYCILYLRRQAGRGVLVWIISYCISPGEQEDDEGEDGRGEDDLHLGVQTRLGAGAGDAAIH